MEERKLKGRRGRGKGKGGEGVIYRREDMDLGLLFEGNYENATMGRGG